MNALVKKYKKEYSHELLSIAFGDYHSATDLMKLRSGRDENIIFMAQQAVEKALKAMLIYLGKPVRHTHEIEILLSSLDDKSLPPYSQEICSLSQFAGIRRYEEGREEISDEDLTLILKIGLEVLNWAKEKMQDTN